MLKLALAVAQSGGTQGAQAPPHCMLGAHRAGFLCFFAKFYKKTMFYHIFKMKWPKSEEKIEMGGLENLGALCWHFCVFFCKKITKLFTFCKMKWPKSEEKIENGGLEKLGGPLDGLTPLPIANVWLHHWALVKWSNAILESFRADSVLLAALRQWVVGFRVLET